MSKIPYAIYCCETVYSSNGQPFTTHVVARRGDDALNAAAEEMAFGNGTSQEEAFLEWHNEFTRVERLATLSDICTVIERLQEDNILPCSKQCPKDVPRILNMLAIIPGFPAYGDLVQQLMEKEYE